MSQLAPLTLAVPLLVAALLILAHSKLGRMACDLIAIATATAVLVMTFLLLVHVSNGLTVYWFGGWHPRHGLAIGVDFAVDTVGSGLASFVSLLMVLALIYSTRFIGVRSPYYQSLMLTFMAGMVGFCVSGDLFNMFVLFELMSVSAVALIGYKVRQQAALEGALNFAAINMIGSFLFILGIAMIYSRTGALNLAQIGAALAHSDNDRVVIVAFTLIAAALLVKAAVVPFHFWLDDAYAVALAPVCLLLAGAMSEIGIYGLGRIWFSAFEPAFAGKVAVVRAILVGAGLLTAVWGGAMALAEDHLKRMLAFITISFIGVFLTGLGLLTADGVAGTCVYVLADGFGKALLFACVGIVQTRLGKVGQRHLHGQGRSLRATGAMFIAGGLLLASMPPFGPFLGKSMIDDAAIHAGYGFVPAFIVVSSALCGAAVLRAGARVFLGWGDSGESRDESGQNPDEETRSESDEELHETTPLVMLIPTALLLAGAVGTGLWFGFADLAATAAHSFVDGSRYRATVLAGLAHPSMSTNSSSPAWFDYLYCAASTLLAIVIAAIGLWGRRYAPLAKVTKGSHFALAPIKHLHTGRIGDYTAALILGVGVFGGLMMATLR